MVIPYQINQQLGLLYTPLLAITKDIHKAFGTNHPLEVRGFSEFIQNI